MSTNPIPPVPPILPDTEPGNPDLEPADAPDREPEWNPDEDPNEQLPRD